jgi:Flp pilus assembly protein protease CpaA
MDNLARWLVVGGIIMILIGGGVYLAGRMGIPFGKLPGDIKVVTQNGLVYIPIVTSCVLSILLTIVLNIIIRFLNR